MSKRDRYDNDRRGDRRDSQPGDEQQRRPTETDMQEGDSLTALKAILAKVAALLKPLQLTQEESIRLVEQLYGSVLETDVRLAGEADDTRKSSVLAHIHHATITRENGKIVVQYTTPRDIAPETQDATAGAQPAEPEAPSAKADAPSADAPAGEQSDATSETRAATAKRAGAGGRGTQRSSARSTKAKPAQSPETKPSDQPKAADPQAAVGPDLVETVATEQPAGPPVDTPTSAD